MWWIWVRASWILIVSFLYLIFMIVCLILVLTGKVNIAKLIFKKKKKE